jgi:hypothetical protein
MMLFLDLWFFFSFKPPSSPSPESAECGESFEGLVSFWKVRAVEPSHLGYVHLCEQVPHLLPDEPPSPPPPPASFSYHSRQ